MNRAYSGDRIVDVYARYKRDILNHKPDYMSILVGINDVAHEADMKNGVNAERFEQLYGMLLDDLLKDLPDLKIMLLEPFYLPGKGTVSTEEKPEKAEYFAHEMPVRASIVKRLAREYYVLTAAYTSSDGKYGQIFVNYTDKDRTVTLEYGGEMTLYSSPDSKGESIQPQNGFTVPKESAVLLEK